MIKRIQSVLVNFSWAALVLLLPITSLPWIANRFGGTMVAPPALIPLIILILIFLIPKWIQRHPLPRQSYPLFWFVLVALAAWAASYFINLPPFREVNRLSNEVSAIITLGIGLSFYLAAATWPAKPGDLQKLQRYINWAGLFIISWSILQAVIWLVDTNAPYPQWMISFQEMISASGELYLRRSTGFAYEPSWLAHQLNMVFLPYWVASTIRKTSAHSCRVFHISFENVLLAGGIASLLLSYSRIGLLGFILMVAYLLLRANLLLAEWIKKKVLAKRRGAPLASSPQTMLTIALFFGLIVVYAGMILGAAYGMSKIDPRMENLFTLVQERVSFNELAQGLVFGERAIFWQVGLEVFSDHPIIGVGLDHSGYFIPQKLPPFGWTMAEPHKLYYTNALPNLMSLWFRLLAETGILGFSIFSSWLYLLWLSARKLEKANHPVLSTMALTGQLVLVALIAEGLSIDSFALPYYWLSLGWLTSAAQMQLAED